MVFVRFPVDCVVVVVLLLLPVVFSSSPCVNIVDCHVMMIFIIIIIFFPNLRARINIFSYTTMFIVEEANREEKSRINREKQTTDEESNNTCGTKIDTLQKSFAPDFKPTRLGRISWRVRLQPRVDRVCRRSPERWRPFRHRGRPERYTPR